MQPRLIRLRDAPAYLGMDKNRFNKEVRPTLIEIPIGRQGVAFDRLDLDNWVQHYKTCNGRPGLGKRQWDAKEHQVSINKDSTGKLIKKSEESAFEKVLAEIGRKNRKKI